MKSGYLSQYFTGVAAKRLSTVEANLFVSNQHEFNGVEALKSIFGDGKGKEKLPAKFIYLSDQDREPLVSEAHVTWYDAREKHPTRSEYRLYFPTTNVSDCAAEGDLLVIGKRPDSSVLVIIAENGSTIGNQVLWLLGLGTVEKPGFSVRSELETLQDRVEFPARFILEQIGVVIESTDESYLDVMLRDFNGTFPNSRDFSEYARSTLPDVKASEDADAAVMAWMEREEILFRELERHLVTDRLVEGFDNLMNDFQTYSASVQNRRKSRVEEALKNHLETAFEQHGLHYSRDAVTEAPFKAEFLFPGQRQYHDSIFPSQNLDVLAVKSSCKGGWHQVLEEAQKIKEKHLLTLDAALGTSQTDEMKNSFLNLVIPKRLHSSYSVEQRLWILDLTTLISNLKSKQNF